MFKFTAKLIFSTLFLTVAFMSISTGEASANTSCGFGTGDEFGVRETGEHSNQMGGLKVKARYASGGPINVNYTLRSDVPGDHKPKTSNGHDYDARIFHWPLGTGRTAEKTFATGENLYPGPFDCEGRSVLGPGEPEVRGNKWVLDCVEDGKLVRFWVDAIQNPAGQQGTWTVVVDGRENDHMKERFTVRNGDNVRIDLVFKREVPVGNIQSVECDRIRLVGYYQSRPSDFVQFRVQRGNGSNVINNKWTNNESRWYNTGLGNTFDNAWPNNVTLKLFIHTGDKYQQVDSWSGRKRCDIPPDSNPNCTHVRFSIPHDSKPLSSTNLWNTPPGQSYYAVYVNDWGSPGRPAAAGSPDYRPNGADSIPSGSGKYSNAPGPGVDYSSYDHPGTETVPQGGSPIDRNLRVHNKVVSGKLVWTLVVYDWFQNSAGVWRIQVQHRETHEINNCFKASCEIDIDGNVPGREGSDAVRAGTVLEGTVKIRNTGVNNLPSWMITNSGTFGLSLTTNFRGGLSANHLNEAIPPGGEIRKPLADFGLVAPNDINNHTLSFYPDYWGRAGIGGWCNKGFRTFKQFNLSPNAGSVQLEYNGAEDIEDPDTVIFNWNVNNVAPNRANVSISTTRTLTKNGSNYPPSPWTNNFTYGDVSHSDSASITTSKLGDEYCGRVRVSPAHGWQGPGGDRSILDPGPRSDGTCNDIANRPYLRAYGADVAAGSRFVDGSGVCNANVNQIRAYTSVRPNKSGSGAQLAGIAMSTIESFRTASLRTSNPTANIGLSFGNTPSPIGQYAGEPICATDFYNETQADNSAPSDNIDKNTVGSGPLSPHSHPNHEQTLYNGNLELNGTGGTPFDGKKIIYVNGNVRITNDIRFEPFSDPTKAPAFMLVARGNIYVANNVKRLDGIYVAQQRPDGSDGTIFTCAKTSGFEGYNDGTFDMFVNCGGPEGENGEASDDKRLIVNGVFIAHHIKFDRIHKSLRDSKSNTNERADHDPGTIPHNTEGSEVFNFSPEIYLSPPPFARDASSASKSPYYTTLPPIL